MEITKDLLITIRKRLEQIFIAKTGDNLDTAEIGNDGNFYCSKTYYVSYGGTEVTSETITPEDLTADLDELVKIREEKEEIERKEREKRDKEIEERRKQEERSRRLAEYNKLKKEFGGL